MTVPEGEAPPLASSGYSPEEAVRDFLRYLPRPGRVLVAFSGGGDSTGLLAVLKSLNAPGSGIDIHAATVDHGLRHGSAEEALAASGFCARLGVPHAILAWSGEKPVTGIQARAREARYRLLAAEA
ncbi:MAG: tRNA lysidine(34) synthetase TilS, partial [Rhizobiaceae bacterium]|nr:tRNA lysidine(34) synthetase TilS [Rhizobiaceae bacterium]